MSQEIYEVIVHGAHSAGMAKFLTDRGALMLRIDPTNKYVFVYDSVFENALAELQVNKSVKSRQ